ncbi:MAG: B12-binding domain-containing radical SAM protein [Deltaproteobacteria bacterium]|nr:B12-binding domain-containing radical SAM protein [Deltaproteobacteria bacterium]
MPVVAMGYLPTVMGPEIMAASDLDAVVQGEPEYAFAELLKAWREGREPAGVPGVLYRKDGAVAAGPPPRPVERFDDLPFPDHGAVDAIDYNEVMVGRRIASIFTARGCPYPCTFCVRSFGRRLSKRSPESVLAEVRHIVNDLGIRNLRIMDDTFTLDEDRAAEICEGFIKLGPVRWTALTRLDHLTEPLAGVMARSGCQRLYCGIESGAQRLLDFL